MTEQTRNASSQGPDNYSGDFTEAKIFGAGAGVTCRACGSFLVLDLEDDINVMETHAEWHRSLDVMHGETDHRPGWTGGGRTVTVRRRKS